MGLFDLFSEIIPELKDLGNEIQGIKDEFISSVVDPSGELRDVVNGIASDFTGQGGVTPPVDPSAVTDAVSSVTSIPISEINK